MASGQALRLRQRWACRSTAGRPGCSGQQQASRPTAEASAVSAHQAHPGQRPHIRVGSGSARSTKETSTKRSLQVSPDATGLLAV